MEVLSAEGCWQGMKPKGHQADRSTPAQLRLQKAFAQLPLGRASPSRSCRLSVAARTTGEWSSFRTQRPGQGTRRVCPRLWCLRAFSRGGGAAVGVGCRGGGGLRVPSGLEVKIQGTGPSLSPLWVGMTKTLVGEVHWKAGKKPALQGGGRR